MILIAALRRGQDNTEYTKGAIRIINRRGTDNTEDTKGAIRILK
jgi:hypothetical protein